MHPNILSRTSPWISSALATFLIGAAGLACGPVDIDDEGVSEEALRTLGGDEIVGEIAYGTSAMEVEHPGETSSRRVYRAVRFEARAGDSIVASAIAGNAADPVLYLLGSSFQTLKSNDDRASGVKDSELTHRISRAGTYYLAFRTKEGWRTKFYVSLRRQGDARPEPAEPPPAPAASRVDMFSDDVAEQATLTDREASSFFSPGASEAKLGDFVLVERTRTCTDITGCAPFAATTKVENLRLPNHAFGSGLWWERVDLPAGDDDVRGTTKLRTTSSGLRLELAAATGGKVFLHPTPLGTLGWLGTDAVYCQNTSSPPYRNCYGYDYLHELHAWGTATARLRTLATRDYVYGRSAAARSRARTDGSYTEAQYAFIASTRAGTAPIVTIEGSTAFASF